MSDEISFPIDNMRQVAQQIGSDTEALIGETTSRIQQIHATIGGLPGSMQGGFSDLFGQLQRQVCISLKILKDIEKDITSENIQPSGKYGLSGRRARSTGRRADPLILLFFLFSQFPQICTFRAPIGYN
jgi:hypothetical protein